ncbi:MAG: hypothetical protein HGA80_04600 [Candidatus Omnitrophica bacterium]|nr:hypothetical protein [Candidatus Omnitrophota bacterium]
MCPFVVINFLIIALVLVLTASYFLRWRSSVDERLALVGGQRKDLYRWTFSSQGQEVEVFHHPGSRNRPSELRLSVSGDFWANCVIRKESVGDRWAQEAGINREIRLGDATIDNDFYFECEDQDFLNTFLSGEEIRSALRNLLSWYDYLEIQGSRCSVVKKPCDIRTVDESQYISDVAVTLVTVARAVPFSAKGEQSATPLTDELKRSQDFFSGLGGALLMLGVALLIWGRVQYESVDIGRIFQTSLWFSLPIAVGLLLYVVHETWGHSTSLRIVMLAAMLVLPGMGMGASGAVEVSNGLLDASQRQELNTRLVDKRVVHHNKGSDTYQVTVAGWETGRGDYSFSVPYSLYSQLSPGDNCVIGTHRGAFGFEWVDERNCVPSR